VVLADVEHPPRVVQRRLAAAQHGVDAGNLPLAAGGVLRPAHLQPVVQRGVCPVDHQGILVRGAVLLLHQPPGRIEQRGGEVAVRHVGAGCGHDVCHGVPIRVGGIGVGEVVDRVQDPLKPGNPRLDAPPMLPQGGTERGRIGHEGEQPADLLQRQLQLAQPADQPGPVDLLGAEEPVPGGRVDGGRGEQADAVVVP
jgi:hypothetical protein